jgi:hypothetical protein
LTAWGAEKAGNKEGTIPAYTPMSIKAPPGWDRKHLGNRPDPFNEKHRSMDYPKDAPFKEEGGAHDKWKIEIEGKPASLKLSLEAVASIDRNEDMHPGDPTIPSYYVTSAILLQAVPVVCAAPPGFVYANTFTNAVEDFHRLATRKTLVT